jgi:3-phenylpropionate/cinnamic acid dioxygenase small subunit
MFNQGSRILQTVATAFCISMLLPRAANAETSDLRDLDNIAACYADGIDAIGAGKADAGAERWRQCFAEEVKFTLTFGAFTMTCPGEKCPMPASMTGLARRIAAAKSTYERAGYVMTSHHITSVSVEQQGAESAIVRGHLQAWHARRDGATVLGLGTWQVRARKTDAGWRIVEEQLDSPMRVVMPKAE